MRRRTGKLARWTPTVIPNLFFLTIPQRGRVVEGPIPISSHAFPSRNRLKSDVHDDRKSEVPLSRTVAAPDFHSSCARAENEFVTSIQYKSSCSPTSSRSFIATSGSSGAPRWASILCGVCTSGYSAFPPPLCMFSESELSSPCGETVASQLFPPPFRILRSNHFGALSG